MYKWLAVDKTEVDKETLRKIDRAIRRNAQKKDGGQDKLRTRIEKRKNAYRRKNKYPDQYEDLQEDF